jgi:hypothetical protein
VKAVYVRGPITTGHYNIFGTPTAITDNLAPGDMLHLYGQRTTGEPPMTHPRDQQTGSSNVGGDHNRTITTGDITGNTGPIAIGWNIVQKILHVEIPIDDKSRQSLIAQVREFWVEGVLDKSLLPRGVVCAGPLRRPQSYYLRWTTCVRQERARTATVAR